jgi:DNA-binding transcriptional LysR family regulator
LDTRHLRAAVAVAEHGSFTRAASTLRLAQSTLSRQVAALERSLGRELFVRNQGSVRLTEYGTALLPHAQLVLAEVRAAEDAVRRADEREEPEVGES